MPETRAVAIAVDEARVLCRLIDEAIDDLSPDELLAWDRLADACGYREWMAERIAACRIRQQEETDGMFIVLGLWAFGHGVTDLDVVPA